MSKETDKIIPALYTNYEGVVGIRHITPTGQVYWGTTEWHPEPGWLIDVYDHEKEAERTYALADADFRSMTIAGNPDWRVRVAEEARIMKDRLDKAEAFLTLPEAEGIVGGEMYQLMHDQVAIMTAYHDVLIRRLSVGGNVA